MFNPEIWFARMAFLFIATVLVCLTHVRLQEQATMAQLDLSWPSLSVVTP